MYNKRMLSKIDLGKYKKPKPYSKDIITDPMGQWKYPGVPTRIPSDQITMQGVNYPVLGIGDNGQEQMMYPGIDYTFLGANYVDEYPQMQDGGEPGDKFKKRLMKRNPGMQGVYGPEGENLNIIKDPNYIAGSKPYYAGDIEFMFPGLPQVSYTNKDDKTLPDYVYKNPSPDKYTSVYNPRGANRADIFLDMLHGMRDDPNYEVLLQNFDKAVRDARGGDMQYFYEQNVANDNYTDGQEQWDNNYADGQLRAQLAPGTLGMFSHGRKDYRKERKYDSPEMRAAAKDIKSYLKTPKKDYIETELTPEEIEEYTKGGFIVEDISVPYLTMQDGGEPKRRKTRYTKEEAANFPKEEWAQYVQEEPEVVVRPLTPEQQAQRNMEWAKNEMIKRNPHLYLPDGSLRPQAAQAADWVWQLGALGPTRELAGAATKGAGNLVSKAAPYVAGTLNKQLIPGVAGATLGNALSAGFAADAIVNRIPEGITQLNNGQYIDAAGNLLTGGLDVATAGMLSPIYQGAKTTASELARFIGTEDGLLSNAYKYNPWAFKPNPEAGYRMIGGKEGFLDAILSGEIRPTSQYENAHFNIGQPLNPNRMSAEELINAGSPGGYKGPYMAEMTDANWQRMSDAFPNNLEMQEQFRLLGKDKDVWNHPKLGNIKVEDPRLKLYKEHWLKGYKEVPKELPGSPNTPLKSAMFNMDMGGYEIRNPDYYTQLLNTYTSNKLSPASKKFYSGLIASVKRQKGVATERQYNELERLKTGNFNFGKKGYQDGGAIETELSDEEIEQYRKGGWIVEIL